MISLAICGISGAFGSIEGFEAFRRQFWITVRCFINHVLRDDELIVLPLIIPPVALPISSMSPFRCSLSPFVALTENRHFRRELFSFNRDFHRVHQYAEQHSITTQFSQPSSDALPATFAGVG